MHLSSNLPAKYDVLHARLSKHPKGQADLSMDVGGQSILVFEKCNHETSGEALGTE
jgi:hypothetical protein